MCKEENQYNSISFSLRYHPDLFHSTTCGRLGMYVHLWKWKQYSLRLEIVLKGKMARP